MSWQCLTSTSVDDSAVKDNTGEMADQGIGEEVLGIILANIPLLPAQLDKLPKGSRSNRAKFEHHKKTRKAKNSTHLRFPFDARQKQAYYICN